MELKVKYRGKEKILVFEKDRVKAKDVLNTLNLSREFAFVVKNGQVVDDDELLSPDDDIRVINAISGGVS
ncbi:MAG: MoaD/ThiS family protein [Hydrogenobacter sp.]|uniref:MoaD/ThiS family protein n=1 Tax=Hydrogenobacter thermophilus TaxID=940 RepID=UPI0030F9FBE8